MGPLDYNIYTNGQVANAAALNQLPLKTEGQKSVFMSDVGNAVDGSYLQYNIVRVNGQKSVYAPILKQGGDTNTIAVVNGIRKAIKTLRDIPAQLHTHVVFDQSVFVKQAISTVLTRRRHRLVPHSCDDSAVSGKHQSHSSGFSFHPAFGDALRFSSSIRPTRPSTAWSSADWLWLFRA